MSTILIVEDELPIMQFLCEMLEDEGYQVITARNGQEGLDRLADSRPDLVLADVMMPLMDGRTMCRSMQANPLYRSIPLILMSAVGERNLRIDGCDYAAFISKPFDPILMLDTIERLMS